MRSVYGGSEAGVSVVLTWNVIISLSAEVAEKIHPFDKVSTFLQVMHNYHHPALKENLLYLQTSATKKKKKKKQTNNTTQEKQKTKTKQTKNTHKKPSPLLAILGKKIEQALSDDLLIGTSGKGRQPISRGVL